MTKDTRKSSTSRKSSNTKKTSSAKGSKAAARKKRKQRKVLFAVEAIVIIILVAAVFVMSKLDKLDKTVDVNEEDIVINEDRDVSAQSQKYTNVALFGIDSRDTGSFGSGNHSDALMIASINNKSGDIKIVSVYRDTYLNLSDDKYSKCTEGYFYGGPQQAIAMLNMNLDLDITKYVSVDFAALVTTIDLLGGLDIDLTAEEIFHLNNYTVETSEVTGVTTEKLPEVDGTYHLDGVQTVSYTRIRYTAGDDFKRTERQRLVIQKIADKAKTASLTTLNNIIDKVLGHINSNFSPAEILGLATDILKYDIVDNTGFPFDKTSTHVNKKDVVVPVTLESNVKQLYEYLFEDKDYTPSATVQNISKKIASDSGISSLN